MTDAAPESIGVHHQYTDKCRQETSYVTLATSPYPLYAQLFISMRQVVLESKVNYA